jgi:anti-sigma regulatory factor (Ser/Thr protein kinase)
MVSPNFKSFRADDRSYFALIKREIRHQLIAAGFDETKTGKVDLIVSEVTSNMAKYSNGAQLLACIGRDGAGDYFELVGLDEGPGIPDTKRVLVDGYSSTGSLGHGLGSIRRLSDLFDLYSVKDWGTILVSRVYKDDLPRNRKKTLDCQGINIPKMGETVSGDGFCYEESPDGFRVLIADGLGHGTNAHLAVEKACEAFAACPEKESPTETIRYLHEQIRKTRGVVGLVVTFNRQSGVWKMAGVGNISARWLGYNNSRSYVSYNGIIGFNIPGTMNDQQVEQEEFQQFIACSDGIRSRWDLSRFPAITQHHGMIVAAAIYKEYLRGSDDASVIVCKSV